MNKPIISVIIPLFNDEKTISRCLDSIVCQMDSIEIICVDDCSSDRTVELVEEYRRNDNRTSIIKHEQNLGTLCSRQDGVRLANGKYIMFSDGDDYYLPNAFVSLSDMMDKTHVDLIEYNITVSCVGVDERYGRIEEDSYSNLYERLEGTDIFDKYLTTGRIRGVLWNKIIRAELCKHAYSLIEPVYLTNHEDILATFMITYFAKSYIGLKERHYVHILRKDSSAYTFKDNTDKIKLMLQTA